MTDAHTAEYAQPKPAWLASADEIPSAPALLSAPYDIEHATRRIGEKAMGMSFPDAYWDDIWAFYRSEPDNVECMTLHDWHLQALAQMAWEKVT